jgi:hypothetical protein
MLKGGYATPATQTNGWSANAYAYGVADVADMYWADAKYTLGGNPWIPFVAFQGGFDRSAGAAYAGTIRSSVFGLQLGATVYRGKPGDVVVTVGFDSIPWQTSTIVLPHGVTCSDTTNQIKATGATLPYFLPHNVPQCLTDAATGKTSIYYGGWASPYTDSYGADPLFTTSIADSMVDRRAPGDSYKVAVTFTSRNKRLMLFASDAWYDLGNHLSATLPQFSGYPNLPSNVWNLDAWYRFSQVRSGAYKGLSLRYRYAQRTTPDTFFASGATWLGGIPLFKYNRAQLEYDF